MGGRITPINSRLLTCNEGGRVHGWFYNVTQYVGGVYDEVCTVAICPGDRAGDDWGSTPPEWDCENKTPGTTVGEGEVWGKTTGPVWVESKDAMLTRAGNYNYTFGSWGYANTIKYVLWKPESEEDDQSWQLNTTKLKIRIRHGATGSCYLKVWFKALFTPYDDKNVAGPTETILFGEDSQLPPYIWNGTGNPCVKDQTKSIGDGDNLYTEPEDGTIIEFAEGDAEPRNGIMYVSIDKWSCLEGYEPDNSDEENPQPNGYPDPAWESAAP